MFSSCFCCRRFFVCFCPRFTPASAPGFVAGGLLELRVLPQRWGSCRAGSLSTFQGTSQKSAPDRHTGRVSGRMKLAMGKFLGKFQTTGWEVPQMVVIVRESPPNPLSSGLGKFLVNIIIFPRLPNTLEVFWTPANLPKTPNLRR